MRLHPIPLLVLLLLTPAAARANCGAEGCPLAPQDADDAPGRFRFDFGFQSVDQDRLWDGSSEISIADLQSEGEHVVERQTRTRAFLLNARAQITDRIQVTASLPWIDRVHRHDHEHHPGFYETLEWRMQGLGDGTVMGHWRAWGGASPTSTSISLQLGAKLPTGKREVDEIDGEQPEPPARPGSGSTDGLVGLMVRHGFAARTLDGREGSVPVFASVLGRVNGKGTEEYRMGNEWQVNVGGGYALTPAIRLVAQVNAAFMGADGVGETHAEAHHTGARAVFASPGLRVSVLPGLDAYGYTQLRIYEHTNGPQLIAPYHLAFGLGYSLGR